MSQSLDAALLAAHSARDTHQLVSLYVAAADSAQHDTARKFYLTHAYVFALETDHPKTGAIRDQLVVLGSEPARQSSLT
ncbi:MAG: hypothetical protein AB8B71_06600 [Paracoccaceae bacterium]